MSNSIIQLDPRVPAGQLSDLIPDARLIRFYDGEDLPEPEALTGLVVLGGRQNAYDPQLTPVAELLKAATSAGVRTLGICLGAQLLATTHGGRVEVDAPVGPERGIIEIRTRPGAQADPLLGPAVERLGVEFCAVSMHNDAVTELPAGAQWLASSKRYPYQAFRIGSALGVQFHPEADARIYAEWLNREEGVEVGTARAQWEERGEELAQLAGSFADGFVGAASADRG